VVKNCLKRNNGLEKVKVADFGTLWSLQSFGALFTFGFFSQTLLTTIVFRFTILQLSIDGLSLLNRKKK
jgi:hypothetical protein